MIRNVISKLVKEEFNRQSRLSILKEEKTRIEGILKEMEDYEGDEIPDNWKEFDDFEFHTSAKDAAMADINADEESDDFEEIGSNPFEKGMDQQSFAEPIKLANMQLPNQEKEVNTIQKQLDFEKKFGKTSLNEKK